MIDMIKTWIAAFRNRRFYSDLDAAAARANYRHRKKGKTVACVYCGGLLPKDEAAFVYDIENDMPEYSHEECWQAKNTVQDGPPVPIHE